MLLTLEVARLEAVLTQAYAAFGSMVENRETRWGPTEQALGAPHPDDKKYVDIGPSALSHAPPEIVDLYGTLLRTLSQHNGRLSQELGFSLMAAADLDEGPILRLTQYRGYQPVLNHPHTDVDLVTLLPRALGAGLQVFDHGGWHPCEVAVNHVLAIAGDIAQEFGGLPPTLHRVVSSEGRRISASFFVNARPELPIKGGSTVSQLVKSRLQAVRKI